MAESKTTLALGEQILELIAVGLGSFAGGQVLLRRKLFLVRTIVVVLHERGNLLLRFLNILFL